MTTIEIKLASLLSDVKVKSHMNTARIKDADDRYLVRAAEENEAETVQCLQEAWRSMLSLCRRFLDPTDDDMGDDVLMRTPETTRTLTLDITERRTSNIGDTLAQAIHTYLVAGTLRRFYTSVAMADLTAMYAGQEQAAANEITNLLYRKQEPTY